MVKYDKNVFITNHVNFLMSRKLLSIKIPFSKKILSTVVILHAVGCIRDFIVTGRGSKRSIRLSVLFYKTIPFFRSVKVVTTQAKKFNISVKGLKLLSTSSKASIFVLSTSRGLMTAQNALRYGIGGLVLFSLS